MSTHSIIIKEDNKNKQYKFIYCQYDGGVDGVGKTLMEKYNTVEKLDELISLGNISSLKDTIEETKKCAYNEEFGVAPFTKSLLQIADEMDGEYIYLFNEENLKWNINPWEVCKLPRFQSISSYIKENMK